MLQKSDFKGKIGGFYLFKSCGWLHEKDIEKFIFTDKKILKAIIKKITKKLNQTTIFDYIN